MTWGDRITCALTCHTWIVKEAEEFAAKTKFLSHSQTQEYIPWLGPTWYWWPVWVWAPRFLLWSCCSLPSALHRAKSTSSVKAPLWANVPLKASSQTHFVPLVGILRRFMPVFTFIIQNVLWEEKNSHHKSAAGWRKRRQERRRTDRRVCSQRGKNKRQIYGWKRNKWNICVEQMCRLMYLWMY